ncbi:Autophagy-related protein 5 like protein [Aduncisulcus paluster]|uniref:Autophagy-related protein 5 like protein n=1 Tax=Aduncisulcus paluster TaxID=2918883 RepID=A0ABQ5K6I9_9EUKA|nr:Autophagy-related protein 5 like protein [Aduncisulcus paluster]|eukprot:gnl/Carplike_NY0171/4915_a6696_263.p1 GENE.gnl/Carplike_NY0171/4915_a6696_263~~gnl/Carplike_NY0171/4915_a6696_263.p1  ORF type:complete len:317 (-),score=48.04 gnl/Carplike_NY0171/4915_a6696_263:369-1319(-)
MSLAKELHERAFQSTIPVAFYVNQPHSLPYLINVPRVSYLGYYFDNLRLQFSEYFPIAKPDAEIILIDAETKSYLQWDIPFSVVFDIITSKLSEGKDEIVKPTIPFQIEVKLDNDFSHPYILPGGSRSSLKEIYFHSLKQSLFIFKKSSKEFNTAPPACIDALFRSLCHGSYDEYDKGIRSIVSFSEELFVGTYDGMFSADIDADDIEDLSDEEVEAKPSLNLKGFFSPTIGFSYPLKFHIFSDDSAHMEYYSVVARVPVLSKDTLSMVLCRLWPGGSKYEGFWIQGMKIEKTTCAADLCGILSSGDLFMHVLVRK